MWKLFLDDRREVYEDGWTIARTIEAAKALIKEKGPPSLISFDWTLGYDEDFVHEVTAQPLVEWLEARGIRDFDWAAHTGSPYGERWLKSALKTLTGRNGVKAPNCSF